MKSVLISIQPKWVEKIATGEKTIEVRKTRPKLETPFKVYIYCTKAKEVVDIGKTFSWGKEVIGEFVCDRIYPIQYEEHTHGNYYYNVFDTFNPYTQKVEGLPPKHCLTFKELDDYLLRGNGYGWHISNLKIYDKPKDLSEFYLSCNYKGICFSCARATFDNTGSLICKSKLTRPPQSWCYVEENKNEQATEL